MTALCGSVWHVQTVWSSFHPKLQTNKTMNDYCWKLEDVRKCVYSQLCTLAEELAIWKKQNFATTKNKIITTDCTVCGLLTFMKEQSANKELSLIVTVNCIGFGKVVTQTYFCDEKYFGWNKKEWNDTKVFHHNVCLPTIETCIPSIKEEMSFNKTITE